MKYIFVIGGVVSGLGKGIASASIAKMLESRGYRVTNIKFDPYVNIDAGTMNPIEHGEVFVTNDGMECDQDIGNYERFLGRSLSKNNYATTGQIYQSVIRAERNLQYQGKCVEVVPHIPQEIIRRIKLAGKTDRAEIVVVEVGGTVGEYQNILFLEAGRMMKFLYPKDVLFILLSYLPKLTAIGEMKTKPTQYAARTLNSAGINADFILGRAEKPLDKPRKEKISFICSMKPEDIISAPDTKNIYQVPLNFKAENLDEKILAKLGLKPRKTNLGDWQKLIDRVNKINRPVKIAIVGKYFATGTSILVDSYISVIEAIKHAAWKQNTQAELTWINSEKYEKNPRKVKELKNFDGVVIPQGWGSRGVEGKIKAIKFLRENKIPYLGLCFGMQMAVIEFARNVCGLKNANSEEVSPKTKYPVIHIMPGQKEYLARQCFGGTIRLGSYPCQLKKESIIYNIYKNSQANNKSKIVNHKLVIHERHRHRYEFNNKYAKLLRTNGLGLSGASPDGRLIEVIELPKKIHPFFVGTQFHPEYQSSLLSPHPIFTEFIRASTKK